MPPFDGMRQAWRWSVRKLLGRWVRITVKPGDAAAQIAARRRPVCYVLEHESHTDLAVLFNACRQLGMPSPARFAAGTGRAGRAHLALGRRAGIFGRRAIRRAPRYLEQLVAAAAAHPDFELDLVPVAIYWGRAPHKELRLWRLLFTEDWVLVGRFKKLLNVIFNGRNTLLEFGAPVALRDALQDGMSAPRAVRRMLRTLRGALRAQRSATIGPDLSHRRTLVAHMLHTQAVRRAVREEMRRRAAEGRPVTRRAALLIARRHALEIAANYSQAFITFMSVVLGWLWNRLYDGVEFQHVDNLNGVGDGAEVIYVPCHRSHMDYLLLSYVVYRKGFAIPHVAAGVNLNMPVIGRFLRMGGAFFLRRSFKGDALYAVVFTTYLGFMMARGHPLEYFVEGGRSRTGRLLQPRTGMLSMTVRSFVHDPGRPVVFMPVYFGYERIVEGRTYIGELSGRPKGKESVPGLLRASVSVLRSRFGKVHVNLGAPIRLDELLDRHAPRWREAAGQTVDAPWMPAVVRDLARSIVVGINSAAAVTPVNLAAMAMLATPRQSLPEEALVSQIELYQGLLRLVPYGPLITVTADSAAAVTRHAESMGILERLKHPLGDIMRMNEKNAVLATYYRNNVLHLFAMPSLIACGFISNTRLRTADLQRLVWRVYPYIASELFLHWPGGGIAAEVDALLDAFAALDLLEPNADRSEWQRPAPTSPEAMRLSLLAEATLQTLERYYLVVALLLQAGSGLTGRDALVDRCHLTAQRMSILYGLNSPEFFDKSLFRNFIDLLRERGVVQTAPDGGLVFGDPLVQVAADARLVLSEQIRRSILQVTLGR
jgi:glycerol-3-phosphate O-acyltransferase